MFQKPREGIFKKDGVIHLLEVMVLSCSVESDLHPWTVALPGFSFMGFSDKNT